MSGLFPINCKLALCREVEAFEKKINILLFNQIIGFVSQLAVSKESNPVINEIRLPWFERTLSNTLQEQYGFRYLGEVLERYEEKVGPDPKNLRAIAIALACSKPLLNDNMFVTDQREAFMKKVEDAAPQDIYLTGALYLLAKGTPREDEIYGELQGRAYTNTEELIFILSLFEELEQKIEAFFPQLIRLMGMSRSLPVIGNMGVYLWVIYWICPLVRNNRKKGMALFRALRELPVSMVRAGSKHYEVLSENGYAPSDIAYANFVAIASYPFVNTPKTQEIYLSSIIAEKVAVEFVRTFLNAPETPDEGTYELMDWVFRLYSSFDIRISGFNGIMDAVRTFAHPENPNTFAWFYRYRSDRNDLDYLSFDLLDAKWDILYQKLGAESYLRLFDNQLQQGASSSAEARVFVLKCLDRYLEVTGEDYCKTFRTIPYRYGLFHLLVRLDIVDLQSYAESYIALIDLSIEPKDDDRSPYQTQKRYVKEYIDDVPDKKAFNVLRYLFEHYSPWEIRRILATDRWAEVFRDLYESNYGRTEKMNFRRPFLSDEEHLQLFSWLENYMFTECSSTYVEFITAAIQDEYVQQICPKEQLRIAFDILVRQGEIANWAVEQLKKKLYSQEELLEDAQIQEEKRKEQEAKRKEEELEKYKKVEADMRAEFSEKYDRTFQSIVRFIRYLSGAKEKAALQIASETMDKLFREKCESLDWKETIQFLKVAFELAQNNLLTIAQFKNYVSQLKEVAPDAENS